MSTVDDPNIVLETLPHHSSCMENKPSERTTETKNSTTAKLVKVAQKRTNADYSISQKGDVH